ncbi:hypothetical protein Tco_1388179 [Tanacetum coccineum]
MFWGLVVRLSIGKPTHDMPCETCHHAKQVREPFPLSEHKVIALGELIHLDLWGPYKVPTIDGFSLSSHKTFFDDFETGDQTSRPNDSGREPSGSNTSSSFDSNDIAEEQSFDDDQESL